MTLCTAAFLWYCADASAESYKMYRYTDANGKRVFVNSMEDVPAEFRLSASTAVVIKDVPPAEPESSGSAKEETANGNAVKALSLNLTATEDGKCGFKGEVKNEMKAKVEAVKLHIDIKAKEQTKSFEVPVGTAGALNPGETVNVTYVADVPAAELAGYSFNVTWQTTIVEAAPARTAQQPPAQAAAPKETPSTQAPLPAPAKRYRTRNHPAAPPAGEK